SASGDGPAAWTVQFTMPSEWTMETLPTPSDDSVRLREVPARTMAAIRYVGDDAERREAAGEELLAKVEAAGLDMAGPVTIAGYDGPSVPQAERRWEAMVEVAR
ncbi:MAG: heme-binding protein, partial [Pseudomonadota bacterium]